MGEKYEVRDKDGKKIGTIERQLSPTEQAERTGEQAATAITFLALFGKPLIVIFFVAFLVCSPILVLVNLGGFLERTSINNENAAIEGQLGSEMYSTVMKGLTEIEQATRDGRFSSGASALFGEEYISDAQDFLEPYISGDRSLEQSLSLDPDFKVRYLIRRGSSYFDSTRIAEATHACLSSHLTGSQRASSEDGVSDFSFDDELRVGLEKRENGWVIVATYVYDGETQLFGPSLNVFRSNTGIDYGSSLISTYCL